jgi:glutamate 5-kinase
MRRNKIFNRVVIKVGTKIITSNNSRLDKREVELLCTQIVNLLKKGVEVILVSSGAVAEGMSQLGLIKRPKTLKMLQAAAAIGQSRLMKIYDNYFQKKKIVTAQVLLTRADLSDRQRYLNARNTVMTLLERNILPVINENDTVSTDEIKFGDNDQLSAMVANFISAQALIILTDVDGLYCLDEEGKQEKIDVVDEIGHVEHHATGAGCELSVGGMRTKLEAARMVTSSGITCIIANGKKDNILDDVVQGRNVGTIFKAKKAKLNDRKKWIAFSKKAKGKIIIDDGAAEALCKQCRSLLSAGIIQVSGVFAYGDLVIISSESGKELARGFTNYASKEIDRIKGLKTSEIERELGYKYYDEIVHRDNLVIL